MTNGAEICWALTQRVDHADSTHVELEESVVDGLASLVVHEEVIKHGAQLWREAGQEVNHAQPRDTDLRPGDVERKQHQEADQRNTWKVETQGPEPEVLIFLIWKINFKIECFTHSYVKTHH